MLLNKTGDIIHPLPPRAAEQLLFVPCAEYMQLRWLHAAEKQPPAPSPPVGGSNICRHFATSEQVCQHPAHADEIIPDFFIGQDKIIRNRKPFPMLCRSAAPPRWRGRKVIKDGIMLRIADDVQVLVFIYDADKFPLCMPAVTEDDGILPARKAGHDLPDHATCGNPEALRGKIFCGSSIQARRA